MVFEMTIPWNYMAADSIIVGYGPDSRSLIVYININLENSYR
jgi:hypothetical protein